MTRAARAGHGIATPGADFHERTANAVAEPGAAAGAAQPRPPAAHRGRGRGRAPRLEGPRRRDPARDAASTSTAGSTASKRSLDGARRAGAPRRRRPTDARRIVVDLARARGARTVVKSKSMATEEIDLGNALEARGAHERRDRPRRVHRAARRRAAVAHDHARDPQDAPADPRRARPRRRAPISPSTAKRSPRGRASGSRGEFLRADIGITGVNFAAADTGTLVLVTNEGNGRFCTTVPRVHIAVMPIEKVIPRLADVGFLLPLLTTHATGQALSNYVTMISGPRRRGRGRRPRRAARRVPRQPAPHAARDASTRRCSRASAAARASTCAPCTATSAGTRTTRCTRARWARCSRRCCRAAPRAPISRTARRCATRAATRAR